MEKADLELLGYSEKWVEYGFIMPELLDAQMRYFRTGDDRSEQQQQAQRIAQLDRTPGAAPQWGQAAPAGVRAFTPAERNTLEKLAALIDVSGGAIRCRGDLALLASHALLANKIAPVDVGGRADDSGVVRCGGDLALTGGHTLLAGRIAPDDAQGRLDDRGTLRCKGDLALTADRTLLADKIAPVDTDGRPDTEGTTEFRGNVTVAKKLSHPAPPAAAKASP